MIMTRSNSVQYKWSFTCKQVAMNRGHSLGRAKKIQRPVMSYKRRTILNNNHFFFEIKNFSLYNIKEARKNKL